MPLTYRINTRKNNIASPATTQYIMQAIHTGEVDVEQLAKEISNECTLTPTDIKAVLYALGIKIRFHLEEGRVVNLENLGRFKAGFKAPAMATAQELSPKHIKKFYINYQPSPKLKKWLKAGLRVVKRK